MADLPPVPDEVYMERVNPLWWGDPGENVVGLVCVDFRADQPQPFTDAVDMGIIGKHEDIAGHASDTIHLMELEFVEASVTRLYGETAIVVVKAHLKGIFQGSSFAGFYRYLRVWLFQEERWQAVAGNVSVVA